MVKQHKCPYLSPVMECLSTGHGHAGCYRPEYHQACAHRRFADERMGAAKPVPIEIQFDVTPEPEKNEIVRVPEWIGAVRGKQAS